VSALFIILHCFEVPDWQKSEIHADPALQEKATLLTQVATILCVGPIYVLTFLHGDQIGKMQNSY
jgi:hypothetical protein